MGNLNFPMGTQPKVSFLTVPNLYQMEGSLRDRVDDARDAFHGQNGELNFNYTDFLNLGHFPTVNRPFADITTTVQRLQVSLFAPFLLKLL